MEPLMMLFFPNLPLLPLFWVKTFLSELFSQTPWLRSSYSERDQVTHPHNPTSNDITTAFYQFSKKEFLE
jgi:hypothetical protein